MFEEIKKIMDGYHQHQNEKAVMKMVIPFIILAGVGLSAILFIPLFQNLQHAKEEIVMLSDRNAGLKYANQELSTENMNLKDSIYYKDVALQNTTAQKKELEDRNKGLNVEVRILKANNKALSREKTDLSQQVKSQSEQIGILQSAHSNMSSIKKDQDKKISEQKVLIQSLQEEHHSLKVSYYNLQKALTFYAFLLTPEGEEHSDALFIDLPSNGKYELFVQLPDQKMNPQELNLSAPLKEKPRKISSGLMYAGLGGVAAALLVYLLIPLYAGNRRVQLPVQNRKLKAA